MSVNALWGDHLCFVYIVAYSNWLHLSFYRSAGMPTAHEKLKHSPNHWLNAIATRLLFRRQVKISSENTSTHQLNLTNETEAKSLWSSQTTGWTQTLFDQWFQSSNLFLINHFQQQKEPVLCATLLPQKQAFRDTAHIRTTLEIEHFNVRSWKL